MSDGGIEELVAYCRERAGDHLRSVVGYGPSGTRIAYRREGVRNVYSDEQLATLTRSAREIDAVLEDADDGELPLGESLAGVYAFEEAYVIHLPGEPGEAAGAVATFDEAVGRSLAGFVRECRQRFTETPA
jgi:hypothetical protein